MWILSIRKPSGPGFGKRLLGFNPERVADNSPEPVLSEVEGSEEPWDQSAPWIMHKLTGQRAKCLSDLTVTCSSGCSSSMSATNTSNIFAELAEVHAMFVTARSAATSAEYEDWSLGGAQL